MDAISFKVSTVYPDGPPKVCSQINSPFNGTAPVGPTDSDDGSQDRPISDGGEEIDVKGGQEAWELPLEVLAQAVWNSTSTLTQVQCPPQP